jgi:thiamine-phosphate pyrophosphorylase
VRLPAPSLPARALPVPPLLVITDRHQARRSLDDTVAALLDGGARWISLREKDLSAAARADQLARLVALGRPYDAIVTVHDDIDAALATGAAGVHLPSRGDLAGARRRLGAGALIGISTHTVAEIARAAEAGADYITLSPIFLSASKPGYGPALGTPALADAARGVTVPVIALGGIDAATARACRAAGAAGIAVMGELMRAEYPTDSARALVAAVTAATG